MRSMMFVWPRRGGKNLLRAQASFTPPMGWAAQQLRLPASWYNGIAIGSGAEFPVSGDETNRTSQVLRFAGNALGIELMEWQERILVDSFGHAHETRHPKDA